MYLSLVILHRNKLRLWVISMTQRMITPVLQIR
nr:MAG TPA_asm: hypothetical protein [Bacteriophage sp.]DAT27335.1 MAG TPA: hypothetical protein [Caudoviricetes sp.]DAV76862.1 MAG TPA: hypothetical protein [Caudoviricetes sp.]